MTQLLTSTPSGDPDDRPEPLVLAWLSRREFALARLRAQGFARWRNHHEFVQERQALSLAYGFAGVATQFQRVPFEGLERWSRLTGAPLQVDGLDEFAGHWRWRADHPDAFVCGRFGVPGDPENNRAGAAGVQCVRILPEIYLRWCENYAGSAMFPPPSLDAYAAHVVECCVCSSSRALCPAVSS